MVVEIGIYRRKNEVYYYYNLTGSTGLCYVLFKLLDYQNQRKVWKHEILNSMLSNMLVVEIEILRRTNKVYYYYNAIMLVVEIEIYRRNTKLLCNQILNKEPQTTRFYVKF